MFWKNLKSCKLELLKPFYRWSLTARLATIYTLTSFCLLVMFASFIYWTFINQLENENKMLIDNTILILQSGIKTQSENPAYMHEEFVVEPAMYHYYVRLIDENEKIIIETPEMSTFLPVSTFTDIHSNDQFLNVSYNHTDKSDSIEKTFLLKKINFSIDNQIKTIQIGVDTSSEYKILKKYRSDLAKTLLLGFIFSATISSLVARKGLKPLKQIAKSAEHITLTKPNERLKPENWPKEISHLATSFNHMLDRIEEGFSRLSQFSGDLAHELRIPITNLMGEAEVVLSRPRTLEEYKNVIGSSLEEFHRLYDLIEKLLFLARSENPKTVIDLIPIDVSTALKEICDYYGVAAEEKNIQLKYEGNAQIKGNPLMFRQAISNLISNALRYTSRGGAISIHVKSTANHTVEISVSDTGKGIAEKHLPHLFERFYRVDSDRSQNTGGTGLGLAIVKSIMDLHQGKITVTSTIGSGTTFTLIFVT